MGGMAGSRTLLILFLFGATVGTFFDGFHTFSGTTAYTEVWALRMAWWTPLVFGLAGAGIGNLMIQVDRVFERKAGSTSVSSAAGAVVLLGIFYAGSGFLPIDNGLMFLFMSAGGVLAWTLYDRSLRGALSAVVVGLLGGATEVAMIHFGLFHYARPDLLGIPGWTVALYALAALTIGQLARGVEGWTCRSQISFQS